MVRTQISFEEDLYRDARAEARRLGISLAELCRRALRQVMPAGSARPGKPWMRFSGIVKGGHRDSSRKAKIDRTVYGAARER